MEKKTAVNKKTIRESLEKQLASRGADNPHFLSLIDDYIFMLGQVKEMKADIRKNGRTIPAVSAAGKEYEKENPAVKNIVLYNRQMLAILKELNLKTDMCDDEDDEL